MGEEKGIPLGLLTIGALGLAGALFYVATRKRPPAPLWEIEDILRCVPEDPGPFTVIDKELREGVWFYHIGEGSPVIDDLGWWSEGALLSLPWSCSLYLAGG